MPDMASEEEERAYTSSCCSDGVEYRLYDIVKVYDQKFRVPHIGKILKMWAERSSGTRKVLVCWFFWHREVKPKDDNNPKELFLASGHGIGVTNELHMDSIIGKCKVVCTSNDPRNKEPSVNDVENADFVFSHAYDVDLKDTVPVEVVADKLGPDAIFNTQDWLIAITHIEEEIDGLQTYESVRSSLSELKKRPRDAEAVSSSHGKKIDRQEDVRKGHVNLEEALNKKKIKVSEGRVPVSKEKAGESLDQSKRQSLKTQTISRFNKIPNADVKEPAAIEGSDLGMPSIPRKRPLDKVEMLEQRELKNEDTLEEFDDEAVPREESEGEDNEGLDNRGDKTSRVEKAQAEEGEEADPETDMPDRENIFKKLVKELEIASESDLGKDGISTSAKKIKSLSSDIAAEKRPTSPKEMVKPYERRRFFRLLPWEQNLQRGIPLGKVLHLQNIDPSVTSADMLEMLRNTFEGLSDARVLPKETACPFGQAVAIFETQLLADSALEAMEKDCLVMGDRKWPVIASKVKESVNQTKFPGHLALERLKLGRGFAAEEWKKAVSTSHCSQPNTIEFEMAMEWRQLQEITRNCRMELFKKQRRELNDLQNRGSSKAQRARQEEGVR